MSAERQRPEEDGDSGDSHSMKSANAGNPVSSQPVAGNTQRPGLDGLMDAEYLKIKQRTELVEAVFGFETKNKYEVWSDKSRCMLRIEEESDCLARQCLRSQRPLLLRVINSDDGTTVMLLDRPLRCTSCLCFCCLQELQVECPEGQPVGFIKQQCNPFCASFKIYGVDGTVLDISGPCVWCICCTVDFEVTTEDGERVGSITKKFSGLCKEALSDADNFKVTFDRGDQDVNIKALMLGAVFLLDFMYFEK